MKGFIAVLLLTAISVVPANDYVMQDVIIDATPQLYRPGEDEGFLIFSIPVEGFEVEISLDEQDDFLVEDAKELTIGLQYLARQLADVKSVIPTHAFNLLRSRILIEYEDRSDRGTQFFNGDEPTIEMWGLEYHRDVLDGTGGYNGNENIMLHELAHAWHGQFIEDGFDNSEIIAQYESALERYELEDDNGNEYYWVRNKSEWFAEFTVMYFKSNWDKPHSKWTMEWEDRQFIEDMWKIKDSDYLQ